MGRMMSMWTGVQSRNIPSMVPSNRRGFFMCVLTSLLENMFPRKLHLKRYFSLSQYLWMVAWSGNTQYGGEAIGGALPAIRVGGLGSALVCAAPSAVPDGKPDSHTF